MKASVFSKETDGNFKEFFALTIKGTTNTVPVLFSFAENDRKGKFTGPFKLNRLDYIKLDQPAGSYLRMSVFQQKQML